MNTMFINSSKTNLTLIFKHKSSYLRYVKTLSLSLSLISVRHKDIFKEWPFYTATVTLANHTIELRFSRTFLN